jgi:hypothetical protein
MRIWLSEDAVEMMAGLEGLNWALYVQEPTGRVLRDSVLVGDH